MVGPTLCWFRRDLRLYDQPMLLDIEGEAVALFVLDPQLLASSGKSRIDHLYAALSALREDLEGKLVVVQGDPAQLIAKLASDLKAKVVRCSEDFSPYGRARDNAVEKALARHDCELQRRGSPYAVSPGRICTGGGTPYRVFTPYRRAWHEHGWRRPAQTGGDCVQWIEPSLDSVAVLEAPETHPAAGEKAALRRWKEFLHTDLDGYAKNRDFPATDSTSRISVHLKYGTLHPRTLLHDLKNADVNPHDKDVYVSELAWREFYADVLFHQPHTAWENVNTHFDKHVWDESEDHFEAWKQGRTGYPIVDAGMRQLLAEGWMHNRVRMITASFLVKDLHLPWQWGARHFMNHLIDGDIASNNHGWQWTAGTGTDAAPYFRIFNPVTQGKKFDPEGEYVQRWVPELRQVEGKKIQEPGAGRGNYPGPIVDHARERAEALVRYEAVKVR